jgi:hypothetical protein
LTLPAALLAALPCAAQEAGRGAPPAPRVAPAAPGGGSVAAEPDGRGSLVIVADAMPDDNQDAIRKRIASAATQVLQEELNNPNYRFPRESVKAERIDKDTFLTLSRFIQQGNLPGRERASGVLALRPDAQGKWLLDLGGPYTLRRLTIEYEGTAGKPEPPEEFKPAADARVQMKALGRYLIDGIGRNEQSPGGPELKPLRFTVQYSDGDKDLAPQTVDFPRENAYWMISLDGFSGDTNHLFNVLADPTKFTNALVSKKLSQRRLVLGSMVPIEIFGDVVFAGNTVTFRFIKPPGTNPKRVWMKFPVSSKQAAAEVERYRGLNEFQVPERIEQENPVRAGGELVKLVPPGEGSSGARWYEIPVAADGLSCERKFELDQVERWKLQARTDPAVFQLIVWELEPPGGEKQAYSLTDPQTKRRQMVRAEEVKGWPVGILEVASASTGERGR